MCEVFMDIAYRFSAADGLGLALEDSASLPA